MPLILFTESVYCFHLEAIILNIASDKLDLWVSLCVQSWQPGTLSLQLILASEKEDGWPVENCLNLNKETLDI